MLQYDLKKSCDPRFLFQGSGYTESISATFRRVVVVHLWNVPAELKRVTTDQVMIRSREHAMPFKGMEEKMRGSQLDMTLLRVQKLVSACTPYSMQQFYNNSVVRASNFIVTNVRAQDITLRAWKA